MLRFGPFHTPATLLGVQYSLGSLASSLLPCRTRTSPGLSFKSHRILGKKGERHMDVEPVPSLTHTPLSAPNNTQKLPSGFWSKVGADCGLKNVAPKTRRYVTLDQSLLPGPE